VFSLLDCFLQFYQREQLRAYFYSLPTRPKTARRDLPFLFTTMIWKKESFAHY